MTRVRSRAEGSNPLQLGRLSTGLLYYYNDPYREYCVDDTHKGPPFRSGGGLSLKRSGYNRQLTPPMALLGTFGSWYYGSFITNKWGSLPASGTYPFLDELVQLPQHGSDGATAWKRFKPGKPVVDLGQAIIELRQIPTIPRVRMQLGFFKDLGGNYLNAEFGWKPFLNDLKKSIEARLKIHDRLSRLKRDNGKWIRKRGSLEDVMTVTNTVETEYGYPQLAAQYYQNSSIPGTRIYSTKIRRKRWFVAKWRYWIPDIQTDDGQKRLIRKLLGLNPTPALLWEVLPWSWLADWFSNIGDVLDNISGNAAENLVAQYAYNMSTYTYEEHVEGVLRVRSLLSPGVYQPIDLTIEGTKYQTIKLRSAANPFGFGLSFEGLTGRQMLILAALGVARHRS